LPAQRPFPPSGRLRSWLGGLVAASCWLYLAVAASLWWLLHWADLWWPATFFLFSPRWLTLVPALGLLILAVLFRRRSLPIALLSAVVIAGPVMGLCIPWPSWPKTPPSSLRVRVLTCNIHYKHPHLPVVERLILTTKPDIVAFQEWPDLGPKDLFDGPDWHIHRSRHLFLASRFPISDVISLGREMMSSRGAALGYELETPVGPIYFFNLHLSSPRRGLYQTIHETPKGIETLEGGSALRRQQSERVRKAAEAVSGPVLLAGDFNTPPESAIFREVWTRFQDAFGQAGLGWGYTFKGGKTIVRIDHVLASPGWVCDRCWVAESIGSPHWPVVAELRLPLDAANGGLPRTDAREDMPPSDRP
jgi:endonuclease/exonuclease/phosphatase (EEP) superfamily protein YafD